uniref:amidohydrolase family protein n=1 Tax=Halobellus rufus TaxID=1448860 RepID=UPI0012E06551
AGQYSSMELVRMLTIEGAEALGVGDEIGSLETGKRADAIVLDVEKPKFTPLTNVPAQVVNNAAPADVETVIVNGDVVMRDSGVKTMDVDAVSERVETAVKRFESETDWEIGIGGSDPPGKLATARDLPKRGPAQILGRLGFQSVKDQLQL